ncbi:hypothetical protein YPPY66_1682, partial [Yersinia pestis PY-66]
MGKATFCPITGS